MVSESNKVEKKIKFKEIIFFCRKRKSRAPFEALSVLDRNITEWKTDYLLMECCIMVHLP